ncbi:MAG: DUF4446 family protein [Armatimonadota bacterium]|nr:DUF4446 family protein [bacterium]
MHQIFQFLSINESYFLFGLSALSLILLICVFSLSRRLGKANKRRSPQVASAGVEDIAEALAEQSNALTNLQMQLNEVNANQKKLVEAVSKCLQTTGIVRFNAFDDVGGEQSFAFALLDKDDTGVVISSLYGRQDSRVYVKSINRGQCERALSEEERKAISLRNN